MAQSTKTLEKSTVVNCAFNQELEGVRWLERSHSCPYKPQLAFQRSRLKDLKSDKKFPKMEMTCTIVAYSSLRTCIALLSNYSVLILTFDGRKLYVLEKPVPEEEPSSSAPKAERDAYKKHVDDANETACLMLATMNSELQK
ncbi:hypothetical protein KIW84_035266 [Lathyrus oleraceus]|uniref:Uncharacterized protein n=1 Tax=Pisum sativum TaxID=3888 RepID=A0A9D5B5S4_PEA|nr:hypothetical protein KIW84_035266 [Pisum sativum]